MILVVGGEHANADEKLTRGVQASLLLFLLATLLDQGIQGSQLRMIVLQGGDNLVSIVFPEVRFQRSGGLEVFKLTSARALCQPLPSLRFSTS